VDEFHIEPSSVEELNYVILPSSSKGRRMWDFEKNKFFAPVKPHFNHS